MRCNLVDEFDFLVDDMALAYRLGFLEERRSAVRNSDSSLDLPLDVLNVPGRVYAKQLTFMDAVSAEKKQLFIEICNVMIICLVLLLFGRVTLITMTLELTFHVSYVAPNDV